jgi:RNA polymerase sigma factor (sigma-70 family)
MKIPENELVKLRSKLRFKAQFHLGPWCPDVDDVVQETMVRLLHAERDGLIRSLDSWVAFANATCNNVIHEYRRRLWRDTPQEPSTQEPQSGSHFSALETLDLVENIIAQLPAKDQQILRAFYLDEKTVDQICAETGINRTHFGVALFRAKERCRKILRPYVKSTGAGNH